MKRKQILAKAITLGLLLAMPCSAWAESIDEYKFSGSKNLTEDTIYTGGLLIEKDASIVGNNKSLDIQGFFYCKGNNNFDDTISGNSIDTSKLEEIQKYGDYFNNDVGLANQGSITGIDNLKVTKSIENKGTIVIKTLEITDRNYKGVHNFADGVMILDNITGYFDINQKTGNKTYQRIILNDGEMVINGLIQSKIQNNPSGIITYNSTEEISGLLENSGIFVVTSGNLKITDMGLSLNGVNAKLVDLNGRNLQSLEVLGDDGIGTDSQAVLNVDGTVTATLVDNYGILESYDLNIIGNGSVNNYSGINNDGATIVVRDSISLANNVLLGNLGNILLSGEQARIVGNGIIDNLFEESENATGIIAKSVDDNGNIDKITNLTIEGTLNNSGIVAAETLNVANGADGSGPQKRGFTQDLGGGWWEVGVGANVNISKASHLYFDIEKTYGGNVATPWQWNAGLRWSF